VCTDTLQATCTPAGDFDNANANAFMKALTIGAGQQGQQKGEDALGWRRGHAATSCACGGKKPSADRAEVHE
jgi:hypothetical protein